MRGERARTAVGDQPRFRPWAALPGRPELLTSSVERCRGRPGRLLRPAEPACTTWSEKTRVAGTGEPAPGKAVPPGAGLRHARSRVPGPVSCGTLGRRAPAVARTPLHKPFATAPDNSPHRLTNIFLRWSELGLNPSRLALVTARRSPTSPQMTTSAASSQLKLAYRVQ